MKVVYTGTSDVQQFGADDFKKADIDGQKKLTFNRGEAVEVSDEVGQALVSKEGIFGDYSFEEADEDDEESSSKSSKKASAQKPATDSGTTQLVDSTPGTTDAASTTGNGSSTRGSTR